MLVANKLLPYHFGSSVRSSITSIIVDRKRSFCGDNLVEWLVETTTTGTDNSSNMAWSRNRFRSVRMIEEIKKIVVPSRLSCFLKAEYFWINISGLAAWHVARTLGVEVGIINAIYCQPKIVLGKSLVAEKEQLTAWNSHVPIAVFYATHGRPQRSLSKSIGHSGCLSRRSVEPE